MRPSWQRLSVSLGGAIVLGLVGLWGDHYVIHHRPASYHLSHWHGAAPTPARWLITFLAFLLIMIAVYWLDDRLLAAAGLILGAGALTNLLAYTVFGGVPDYIVLGHIGGKSLIWTHGDFAALIGLALGLLALALEIRRQAQKRRLVKIETATEAAAFFDES